MITQIKKNLPAGRQGLHRFLKKRCCINLKNKGYLLIEVLVTVIVLGTAIVFIVRALNASLMAVRRAASYTKALLLAEQLFSDIKLETFSGKAISLGSFPRSEGNSLDNRKLTPLENASDSARDSSLAQFSWKEELEPTGSATLSEIIFTVFWKDSKLTGEICASTFIPTTGQEGD